MRVFDKLRTLTAFQKQHLPQLKTLEDHQLIQEIGYHEAQGRPLTLKQIFLLDAGSIATVQRRLRRLRQLGVIEQRRSAADRRAVELRLSAKYQRMLSRYGELLAGPEAGGPCHVCSPYDGQAAQRKLARAFLSAGLRQGDACLLVAPRGAIAALLASLGERRRNVVTSEGERSAAAQLAFYRERFAQARRAGKAVRAVCDTGWALDNGLSADELMRLEAQLEPLVQQFGGRVLCLYDAQRFSAPLIVQALKCHRDATRLPLLLA